MSAASAGLDPAERRLLAMTSPAGLGVVTNPNYRPARFHANLAQDAIDLINGEVSILAASLAVQHGKSELMSVLTAAWFLGLHPDRHVICCSYSSEYAADRIGRRVRDILDRHGKELFGVEIDEKSAARHRWNTTADGGLVAAGVGAGIAGRPGQLIIMDDVYAGWEDASNRKTREAVWEWYQYEVASRMAPGAGTILCNSRWHEDDFFNRLVTHYRGIPEAVVRVRDYPALSICSKCGDFGLDEIDQCGHGLTDALGRVGSGQPLWPENGRDRDFLLRQRQIVTPRPFSAMYQGRPYPDTGLLFNRSTFKYAALDGTSGETIVRPQGAPAVKLEQCIRFQIADLAISQSSSADFFVLGTFLCTPSLDLIVVDIVRERAGFQRQIDIIKAGFAKWKPIGVAVEAVSYQMAMVEALRAHGLPINPLHPHANKEARAMVVAGQLEAGKVFFLAGAPWLDEFQNELVAFGSSAHDDQVDVFAYAGICQTEFIAKSMAGGPQFIFRGAPSGGGIMIGDPYSRPSGDNFQRGGYQQIARGPY